MKGFLKGIIVLAYVSPIFSQFTRLTDEQTDGRTDGHFAHR